MSQEVEYTIDDRTLLVGNIIEEDASFDHPFGREKRVEYKVEDFAIIIFINGIDYDVTKAFEKDILQAFKEDLIYYYINEIKAG